MGIEGAFANDNGAREAIGRNAASALMLTVRRGSGDAPVPIMTAPADAALSLLGGAQRSRPRVRGFAPWSPQPETQALQRELSRKAVIG
jgi:hypothetical protein